MHLFLHIPKTAGTTLRGIVDAQYGAPKVLLYYNQTSRQLLDNLEAHLTVNDVRALIGHFDFGVHENVPGGARYVTFLRDPAAHVYSTYTELLKAAGPTNHPEIAAESMSFEDALARVPDAFRDLQTRYLAHGGEQTPADTLARAQARLEEYFDAVGLVERFDESVLLISRRLGWQPCRYRALNKGAPMPDFGPETAARIDDLTQLDRALYAWAEARFEAALAAEPPAFADALTELAAANAREASEAAIAPELTRVAAYLNGAAA